MKVNKRLQKNISNQQNAWLFSRAFLFAFTKQIQPHRGEIKTEMHNNQQAP
jgi:transcriptional regulator of met regulon